jgi:Cu-processing system permease protein
MNRISKYVLYDIARNKVIIAYTAFLFIVSMSLFQMEENSSKAMLSLLNIVLLVVPLVSLVFSTIHWYNSYEFIELMMTQPISRRKVFMAEYAGISLSMISAIVAGIGVPVLIYHFNATGLSLVLIGCLLSLVFTSIAFWSSVTAKDKARGIGIALLLWFYFALVFDGLLMLVLFAFSDYPLEQLTLFLSSLNPIDLGRIFIMLHMDVSALMGYTGATYKNFFGSALGLLFTLAVMIIWIVVPLVAAYRSFRKKDL